MQDESGSPGPRGGRAGRALACAVLAAALAAFPAPVAGLLDGPLPYGAARVATLALPGALGLGVVAWALFARPRRRGPAVLALLVALAALALDVVHAPDAVLGP